MASGRHLREICVECAAEATFKTEDNPVCSSALVLGSSDSYFRFKFPDGPSASPRTSASLDRLRSEPPLLRQPILGPRAHSEGNVMLSPHSSRVKPSVLRQQGFGKHRNSAPVSPVSVLTPRGSYSPPASTGSPSPSFQRPKSFGPVPPPGSQKGIITSTALPPSPRVLYSPSFKGHQFGQTFRILRHRPSVTSVFPQSQDTPSKHSSASRSRQPPLSPLSPDSPCCSTPRLMCDCPTVSKADPSGKELHGSGRIAPVPLTPRSKSSAIMRADVPHAPQASL